MALVKVKFRNGETGMVMQREIEGLRKAGLLADSSKKEEKTESNTKEHKEPSMTKKGNLSGKARPTKKARETVKPRPVDIGSKNIIKK